MGINRYFFSPNPEDISENAYAWGRLREDATALLRWSGYAKASEPKAAIANAAIMGFENLFRISPPKVQ